jgi:hypothetical protein
LSAIYIAPYLQDQRSRPVIVTMGFLRAILPFLFSFIGSAVGRNLTYNTFHWAHFRWQPIQRILNFYQYEGVYQDTILDTELEHLGRMVATALGHGTRPAEDRLNLTACGFHMVGAGNGGYAVYETKLQRTTNPEDLSLESFVVVTLHVTPYGPSILDEMPRYIVLERRRLKYKTTATTHGAAIVVGTTDSDATILNAAQPTEAAIYGFTYSGAFFKNQEWAALTARFQEEMEAYTKACRRLGTARAMSSDAGNHRFIVGAPTDLSSLKDFIRSGHAMKRLHKEKRRMTEIESELRHVSKLIAGYQQAGTAPKRVILYLEGLDCSGKSSTAGLICRALEQGGFEVDTTQHNRPPTKEQQSLPWMDRSRFEYPQDVILLKKKEELAQRTMDQQGGGEEEKEMAKALPEYAALVWDRGPAGDFVYGKLRDASLSDKLVKYQEFRSYDATCHKEGILFCKLLFVTNKDSIASTLGKRLAHKKVARELRTWINANWVEQGGDMSSLQGLEDIEHHIDPTDFVAFNKYEENLAKFTEFARNTDTMYENKGNSRTTTKPTYDNPWTVVNTSKRHPARLGLLKEFRNQLVRFATAPPVIADVAQDDDDDDDTELRPIISNNLYVKDHDHGISIRAIFQSMLLLMLVYAYGRCTWKFDVLHMWDDED